MKIAIRRERLVWKGNGEVLKLLHVSDLHVKWSARRLEMVEEAAASERPDVVVMTGDYSDTPRGAALCAEFLDRISAVRPVCWISGNHDRWFGDEQANRLRAVTQARCVDDAAWEFTSAAGQHCRFLSWKQHLAARADTRGPEERRIVLVHDPEEMDACLFAGCDLVLAGHLHGGQFIFWRSSAGSFFPGNLLYRWCCDRREVGGTTVIVSKGLGDTVPVRFRCPHELVVVEIH